VSYVQKLAQAASCGPEASETAMAEAEIEHSVFMQAYIPQSLMAVKDPEAETSKLAQGDTHEIYHGILTGAGNAAPPLTSVSEGHSDSSDTEPSDEENDSETKEVHFVRKGSSKDEKRAHKKEIKEQKREKRKTKIPKSEKKRHAKAAK
jgi:RIO kinase 1